MLYFCLTTSISELNESPSHRPDLSNLLPKRPAGGNRLGRVEAMFVVAVARPLGSARSCCATMHPAAPSPGHDRRAAWRSRAGLGAIPSRQAQLFGLLGRVRGVVLTEATTTCALGWSSGLTQPLSQRPQVSCELPQPAPRGDHFSGLPAMLVVAVALPLGSASSCGATMHPAAPFPGDGGRPAGRSRACPGATPSRLAQLFWLLGRVYGVVRHFSRSAPALPSLKPD